jgi:hypothetical protein
MKPLTFFWFETNWLDVGNKLFYLILDEYLNVKMKETERIKIKTCLP